MTTDRSDNNATHYGTNVYAPNGSGTGGAIRHTSTTVTASATAVAGRYYTVDSTSGSVTMTLPTLAATDDGAEFVFYKLVAANSMIIDGAGAETIEGAANVTRTSRYATVRIRKAGTVWQLVKAEPNTEGVSGASVVGLPLVVGLDGLDLVGANTAAWHYRHPPGSPSCTVASIATRLSGALTTGDATITGSISTDGVNFTAITNGVVTITQASSAAGDLDVATPTAANTLAAGNVLRLLVGGTNDAARTAAAWVRLATA